MMKTCLYTFYRYNIARIMFRKCHSPCKNESAHCLPTSAAQAFEAWANEASCAPLHFETLLNPL